MLGLIIIGMAARGLLKAPFLIKLSVPCVVTRLTLCGGAGITASNLTDLVMLDLLKLKIEMLLGTCILIVRNLRIMCNVQQLDYM